MLQDQAFFLDSILDTKTNILSSFESRFQAERKREIDRRSSSKTLTEAQKDLKERQAKKLKDQIEKDKRDEIEYKKRVKQALEEDKARRKAEREKAQAAVAATAAQSSPLDSPVMLPSDIRAQNSGLSQARNDAAPALAFESSRLNIRLFDGSSIRNTFKATDTLEQVRNWIDAVRFCSVCSLGGIHVTHSCM